MVFLKIRNFLKIFMIPPFLKSSQKYARAKLKFNEYIMALRLYFVNITPKLISQVLQRC